MPYCSAATVALARQMPLSYVVKGSGLVPRKLRPRSVLAAVVVGGVGLSSCRLSVSGVSRGSSLAVLGVGENAADLLMSAVRICAKSPAAKGMPSFGSKVHWRTHKAMILKGSQGLLFRSRCARFVGAVLLVVFKMRRHTLCYLTSSLALTSHGYIMRNKWSVDTFGSYYLSSLSLFSNYFSAGSWRILCGAARCGTAFAPCFWLPLTDITADPG